MDYSITIWSIVVFIENRLQGKISYDELETACGFSMAYIREVFVKQTGMPLSKYILNRKIANAAFDILHSNQNILEIAVKYGFGNPDTFTRAFKRIVGLTPGEFRKRLPPVGRIKLCAGVYGVGLLNTREEEA